MPFAVAVCGFKDSGKSTLCYKLLEGLRSKGLRVAYVKRTQEEVLSPAGTDSGDGAALGFETLLWGRDGVRCEAKGAAFDISFLTVRFFSEADFILVEGGKELSLPKIWVGPPGSSPPGVKGILAYYHSESPSNGVLSFRRGEEEAMIEWLYGLQQQRASASLRLYLDYRELPLKDFVADMIAGGLRGMIMALKGGEAVKRGAFVYLRGDKTGGER
ncbi:molybdopterin-guanine dinucleotide biosynthesis protein MobB [Acetomicrobium sp. S15 = DSM 107314]|jgi:molybdopterin-guanine dinucleotide biosynthesis protein B|uniref:molybdopterin-guanine dinucleotide biosynthesis protein MobB n=1 Tax=Acetomicrobium sp. S15 = DSM 107314 TaxID=2529858 RepID=UPI0018E113CF|nr:molybdopterin-guanine dinucleotide biosynthesis protein MobB [Acetomicrobium sp. S15 = DSM 107314]